VRNSIPKAAILKPKKIKKMPKIKENDLGIHRPFGGDISSLSEMSDDDFEAIIEMILDIDEPE